MSSIPESSHEDEAPLKPRMRFTVLPVGRDLGRRLGGISSGISRREGRERGEAKGKKADPSFDPWADLIVGAEQE